MPAQGAYALAVFDFDGTLADSAAATARALDQAADRFDFRRTTAADKAALRGLDARAVLRALGLPAWKLPRVARFMRERVAQDAAAIRLFPGVAEMLCALRERGVVLAIVSSNAEATVRRILGPDCAALIGLYECGVAVFGKAPRFRRVLKRAGVAAADAICIGDETRDVEAAAACGLRCGAVAWGYATPEALRRAGPTVLFETVAEIVGTVAGQVPDTSRDVGSACAARDAPRSVRRLSERTVDD